MRLFAAIGFEPEIRDRLSALQRGVPEGRVTAWENLHLSLGFFGEVDGAVAADLHAALGAIRAPAFEITLDGVAAFGGARPRLLYAGVRAEPALFHLQSKVAQAARGAGVALPAERFSPHVTLKRLKPGEMSASRVARWLQAGGGFMAGPILVESFGLFRSTLGRAAPVYEEIARYPLADGAGRR
ncbi:RNA 2',3'-cyclic phosphodiesterase [Pikeienuella sp. HZG-20]|uniref:RNA 2',3'-cyclic phosphodiesterase n=1 Tax=Paludibacillus litoralis TaxID=3133267 RepID=UPI0030EC411B